MAKLRGIFKVLGSLEGVTIYETQDGFIVRKKGVPNAERLKNDGAYEALRRQAKEFGACTKAAKLLRDTLMPLLENSIDNRVSSRLNKVMNSIKNMDNVSSPGKRTVGNGLLTDDGRQLLNGFNFNDKSQLNKVLLKKYLIDRRKGQVVFDDFLPLTDLRFPKSTSHVALHCGLAHVDFERKTGELKEDYVLLPLDGETRNVVLKPDGKLSVKSVKVMVLKTVFLQEVNGHFYELEEGSYNAAGIVDVWMGR